MPFNLQPTLENDFLLLRPLREEDFEALYQAASDPLIWEQHPVKRFKRKEFELFFNDSMASKGALVVIDKNSNKIIGSSRFKEIDGVGTAVEIGWSFLARTYWGGKYNKKVKSLMMDHAFSHIEDVIYYIDKDNIRSQKAVEKLGGKRVSGPEHKHLMKKNERSLTYRIQKKNWLS